MFAPALSKKMTADLDWRIEDESVIPAPARRRFWHNRRFWVLPGTGQIDPLLLPVWRLPPHCALGDWRSQPR